MGSRQYLYVGNYIRVKDENFNLNDFSESIGKWEELLDYTDVNTGNIIFLNLITERNNQGQEWDLGEISRLDYTFENPKPFSNAWDLIRNELSKNNIEFEEVYGVFVYLM